MVSCFDDLNIDLLYEIFDYLSFLDLIKALFRLKEQLDKMIQIHSAKIDLTLVINKNFKCLILRNTSCNKMFALMHHTPNLSYCEVYLQDRITDLSLTNVHLLKLNRFHLNINVN
jgi:hypothetical protein